MRSPRGSGHKAKVSVDEVAADLEELRSTIHPFIRRLVDSAAGIDAAAMKEEAEEQAAAAGAEASGSTGGVQTAAAASRGKSSLTMKSNPMQASVQREARAAQAGAETPASGGSASGASAVAAGQRALSKGCGCSRWLIRARARRQVRAAGKMAARLSSRGGISADEAESQLGVFVRAHRYVAMYTTGRYALEDIEHEGAGRACGGIAHAVVEADWYRALVFGASAALILLTVWEGGAAAAAVGGSTGGFSASAVTVTTSSVEATHSGAQSASQLALPHAAWAASVAAAASVITASLGWLVQVQDEEVWRTAADAGDAVPGGLLALRNRLLLAEAVLVVVLLLDALVFAMGKGLRKPLLDLESGSARQKAEEARADAEADRRAGGSAFESFESEDAVSPTPSSLPATPVPAPDDLASLSGSKASPVGGADAVKDSESSAFVRGSIRWLWFGRVLLLLLVAADVATRTRVLYTTGRMALLLPVTAVLRPVLLLTRVPALRAALVAFGRSVLHARRVIALWFSFLLVVASLSLALFGGDLATATTSASAAAAAASGTTGTSASSGSTATSASSTVAAADGFSDASAASSSLQIGRGYASFVPAFLTTFIFVTTGENWNTIHERYAREGAVPAANSAWLDAVQRPYFVLVSFLGLFVLSALLIASFQNQYTELSERRKRKLLWRRRVALVIAFVVLDDDASSELERSEYASFFTALGVRESHWGLLPNSIGVAEFVRFCELLKNRMQFRLADGEYGQERTVVTSAANTARGCLRSCQGTSCGSCLTSMSQKLQAARAWLRAFFNNEKQVSFDVVARVTVVVHVWLVTLYGTTWTAAVDAALTAMLLTFAAEVLLRLLAVGWSTFFSGPRTVRLASAGMVMSAAAKLTSKVRLRRGKAEADAKAKAAAEKPEVSARERAAARAKEVLAKRRARDKAPLVPAKSAPKEAKRRAGGGRPAGSSSKAPSATRFQTAANRCDFLVLLASVALAVAGRAGLGSSAPTVGTDASTAVELALSSADRLTRVGLVLPVLRLFSVVHSTRQLVFGLLVRLPSYAPLLVAMVTALFLYAVVGCWLFGGLLTALPQDVYSSQRANFNSMDSALTTLAQLLVGEGWHDIMFGAFDALASLWPAAYFLSFIALNTLLFSSIFVGIVCDTFEAIQRRSAEQGASK